MSGPSGIAMPDPDFWHGRRVLLTGHTGFKGSWLTCWLRRLGADVLGVSLPAQLTGPSLWDELALDDVQEVRADIATTTWMDAARAFSPEVVLHLAAQSLVSVGHQEPARTFRTNVQGTVQLMSFLADLEEVEACLVVTTDKVYDPRQKPPHREDHFLGGLDPYSASKAAGEFVVHAWPATSAPCATARAGNVIGGGDWASDRLLPDLLRSWQLGVPAQLRRPRAVRPWQHVLEPLRGYLVYAQELASGRDISPALNFGPTDDQSVSVTALAQFAAEQWTALGGIVPGPGWTQSGDVHFNETAELTLDSQLAFDQLGWAGVLDWQGAVSLTLEWHRALQSGSRAGDLVSQQLETYTCAVEGHSS